MTPACELYGVEYAYDGNVVLNLDNLQINAGCITALVGPNGSGKSTLLDIIALINIPINGKVKIFGNQADGSNRDILRRRIGYVQQKPYLLNTSVYKNIELGLKLRRTDKATCRQATTAIIDQFALGNIVHRRAHGLSGGEAQKVAIARAMVMHPEILIFDEPFSHLDKSFKVKFEAILRAIRQEATQTIIISTHDQVMAQSLADHVCTLIDGQQIPAITVNTYTGRLDKNRHLFLTDNLEFHVPDSITSGTRLCIDAVHLVISNTELKSSMRNSFPGVVKSIRYETGRIQVCVDAGEEFLAIITRDALNELAVNVGDPVWVSFKSTAIRVY